MNDSRSTPLVLLHAFPLNSGMWESLVHRTSNRRTLAPDLPGFGSRPPGRESLDGFADAVIDDLDRAGIDRGVFLGLSMGGYVAFRIWARYRTRVAGLILADTRAGTDSEEAAANRLRQAEQARMEGVAWLPDEMLGKLLGESTRREHPEVVAKVRSLMAAANGEGVARALIAMRSRPDSRPLLATIDVPVLVLVGEEDRLTNVDEARTIEEGVGGAELQVIPRAGHLANLENPEAFEAAVAEFLGKLDAI